MPSDRFEHCSERQDGQPRHFLQPEEIIDSYRSLSGSHCHLTSSDDVLQGSTFSFDPQELSRLYGQNATSIGRNPDEGNDHRDDRHHGQHHHRHHHEHHRQLVSDQCDNSNRAEEDITVSSAQSPCGAESPEVIDYDHGYTPTETQPVFAPPVDTTTQPTDSTNGGTLNPYDGNTTPVVPNTSISDLTNLSEELLPIHSNGSYPSTADWEDLHSANVQKAETAAQIGSNLQFFGDSITEAMGYNPAAMQPFNDAFGAAKPIALGLGGDGTAQLLYRLNHGELQGQPKAVVLMIGTNDIGSLSPEQIAENTERSIESIQLRSPGTRVMVMGILPRPDAGDPGNTQVDAANEALSHLATADGAVQFANLRDSFVDGNGNERAGLYQNDRLHLSPAGYQAWADGVQGSLDRMLSEPAAPAAGGSLALDTAGIRGVNLSGAEWGKNSSEDSQFWPTTQELDYFKSKGMNTFRLAISWEQFQPTLNGPLDQHELARLDNFLHAADERGVKVLLNLANFDRYSLGHGPNGQGVDGETEGTVVGQPGVPVSALQDFWTKIVEHVDADPSASRAVGGWDLTNEPHDVGGSWPATATAVDQAIRATGDNHTVVVEGDQWATDFRGLEGLAKLDKNVAFEAHTYWDDGSGGYANPNPPTDNPNIGVEKISPFVSWLRQNDARGFVGEWGVPTNNTAWDPAVTNFIHFLNQNGVGNMVWAGGPGWQPDYTLSVEPINGQDRPIMSTIVEANQS